MLWLQFLVTAGVIVLAGTRLARYGDALGEKTGLGRSAIGVVALASTTSLPELFTGIGATVLRDAPDIAVGNVLGACMFNLLILSLMDALQPEPLSTRAHQSHALSIGFGLLLTGVVGLCHLGARFVPSIGWVSLTSPTLLILYFVSVRTIFTHQRHIRASETREVAEELQYGAITLRAAALRYAAAAVIVVVAALQLPSLGSELARQTGLGEAFVGSLFIAITTSLPEIVVAIAAVRMGAIDLGIANVLGSILFNLAILAFDDILYTRGPLLLAADASHVITILAIVTMNALFLIGLTYRVLTKRFAVAWDTGAMAAVYAAAVWLSYIFSS